MSIRSRATLAVIALGLVTATAPAFAADAAPAKKVTVHHSHKMAAKKVKATKPAVAAPAPDAAAPAKP